MALHEHVFQTFVQGDKNVVDLGVARSMHVNTLNLSAKAEARTLIKIAAVTRKKYIPLCEVWGRYKSGQIDKAHCLSEFKKFTEEVYPNG